MFCRRPTHRRQQVYRWCITSGFLRHFGELDDAWRWRFMHYILNIRMGMPPETWKRASGHPNFTLHTSADWLDAAFDIRAEQAGQAKKSPAQRAGESLAGGAKTKTTDAAPSPRDAYLERTRSAHLGGSN